MTVALLVAALHLVTGPGYRGPAPGFVNGYLVDLLLPFSLVLLLGLVEHTVLRPSWVRALLVFLVGSAVEVLQYSGLPLFGETFDPFDFLAYAGGALAAMAFERLVLLRTAHRGRA